MKKLLFLVLCLLPFMEVAAHEKGEKSKKDFLPKAGDWSVGIDVIPVFKFIGNTFNGNLDNDMTHLGGTPFVNTNKKFQPLSPDVSIMGKYLVSDNFALRANVGLMIRSEANRMYSVDDQALSNNPLSEDKVIDKMNWNRNGMSIALGGEYRKGTRRVQGVFGAGVLFAFQSQSNNYTWGNEMTTVNQLPSSATFGGGSLINRGYRTLKNHTAGSDFYIGLTGSVGVEWFFCPKVSLGAEVNLVAYYMFGSQTYVVSEGYNAAKKAVEERTDLVSPGNRGFYLTTESLGGSLNLNFYF